MNLPLLYKTGLEQRLIWQRPLNKPVLKPDITLPEYNRFRDYLEKHSGIVLGDNKQYLVQSRLKSILKTYELGSLDRLLAELECNARSPLKQVVIDAMTTNETSWFRDNHPYTTLKNRIFDKHLGQSRLRVWSAACSSGQEPYSVSMVFEEWLRESANSSKSIQANKPSLEIVATDLSLDMLSVAQSGCYDDLAMKRGLSEQRKAAFFSKRSDNCWQVESKIQQRVRFQPLNLLDSYYSLGSFDAVFCRNVLIYFSPEAKKDILERLHQVLKPGGYLFLGGAESFINSALFKMEHCHPGIVYRAL